MRCQITKVLRLASKHYNSSAVLALCSKKKSFYSLKRHTFKYQVDNSLYVFILLCFWELNIIQNLWWNAVPKQKFILQNWYLSLYINELYICHITKLLSLMPSIWDKDFLVFVHHPASTAPAVRRCLTRTCYINHVEHHEETTLWVYEEANERLLIKLSNI